MATKKRSYAYKQTEDYRQRQLADQRRRYAVRKRFFDEYKLKRGCGKCGYNRCASALEFHHRNPEEKFLRPSRMVNYSMEKIEAELEKCIVLCANCHREEHPSTSARTFLEEDPPDTVI